MPTVFKEHGCRFVIYLNDHPPPHVHVLGEGYAIVILDEGGVVVLVEADGFSRPKLRKILKTAEEQNAKLLQDWRKIHG